MLVQIVAIILLAAVALVSFLVYNRMNSTQYIEYTEAASVDYKVQYKNNEFFDGEWIDKDQSYISSLVNGIAADFEYKMDTESAEMKFDYKYAINAKLVIASKIEGTPYYTFEENIIPAKSGRIENRDYLEIRESAIIDFVKFDEIARRFVDKYGLDGTALCTLEVSLDVNSECGNNGFAEINKVVYSTALVVPLATDTFNIHRSSSAPDNEPKALEYNGAAERNFFLVMSSSTAFMSVLLIFVLFVYLHLTKNEDIAYASKVRKILRDYASFIQRIEGEFDVEGYQIVNIKTFVEMLGIRDTIQSPVLMSENNDETMTRFFIPTPTKLLYVFEIKVDNYDEIYGVSGDTLSDESAVEEVIEEPTVEEVIEEPTFEEVIEEPTVEEVIEEPAFEEVIEEPTVEVVIEEPAVEEVIEEPAVEEVIEEPEAEKDLAIASILDNIVEADSDSNESEDADVETVLAYFDGEGNTVKITCTRSFTANLIQSNPQIKEYYNEIKNYILSFKGIKARTSWRCETYKKGRIQLFKMKIRGKMICLYCALDPNDYDSSKYFHKITTSKAFANVPMLVRIKSDRGLKRAKALINDVMAKFFILPNDKAESVDYVKDYPYDTTKNLVERKLIKLLLPDAVAAEPKPHHHIHKKTVEIVHDDVVEQIVVLDTDKVDDLLIEEIVLDPTPELENIDYDDESEEIGDFVETEEHHGVDVIGVVWPERPKRNKIYRYDPDGEIVSVGDVVIVPTGDASRQMEVIRKAVVAHANHKVATEDLKYPLKKIVGVIRTNRNENADTKAK